MRDLLRAGSSAFLLVVMMFVASLGLWVGVPVAWIYVGSQVQGETGSLGAALGATAIGILASIVVIVAVLGWLARKHSELREARGLEGGGQVALEAVMAVSATLALVTFAAWFFLFSGSSPIPIQGQ